MRWRKKPRKKLPRKNEERIVSRFLFFPTTNEGETRWLETACIKQYYNDYTFRWHDWKWAKQSEWEGYLARGLEA